MKCIALLVLVCAVAVSAVPMPQPEPFDLGGIIDGIGKVTGLREITDGVKDIVKGIGLMQAELLAAQVATTPVKLTSIAPAPEEPKPNPAPAA